MFEDVGNWLLAIAAEMPFETDWESSLKGSWYLSPRRHTVEFFIYNALFVFTYRYFYNRALYPGSPISKLFESYVAPAKKSKIEISVMVTLILSLLTTVYQKWARGGLIYLLQPCHMSAMLLITILAGPKNKKWPHVLLNIYFHIMWGTMLALLSPDLRDYDLFFEVENFFIGPLQSFGKWYRPVMYATCVFFTMTRYFLIEVVIQLLPRRNVVPAQQETVVDGKIKRKIL
ncbi:hypothetical protein BGZ72_007567 [Mortierella alpina]|nr:hypothetical protein BGZ72_007567 [Mortierella alpina]